MITVSVESRDNKMANITEWWVVTRPNWYVPDKDVMALGPFKTREDAMLEARQILRERAP